MCTANMCRSPMAEAFLQRHLAAAGVPAEVGSCGLLAAGSPAAPDVVEVMSGMGFDLSPHRSRRLSSYLIEEADLVLAMTREHLREAVLLHPPAFGRAFTLKELVRRGERVGPRRGASLADWLSAVGSDRRPQELLGTSPENDVADPIGGPLSGYRAAAAELDDLTRRLALLLAG